MSIKLLYLITNVCITCTPLSRFREYYHIYNIHA